MPASFSVSQSDSHRGGLSQRLAIELESDEDKTDPIRVRSTRGVERYLRRVLITVSEENLLGLGGCKPGQDGLRS